VKRPLLFASGIFIVGLFALGCTDNGGNGPGNPGTAGAAGGGTGGTAAGGNGGTAAGGSGGTTPGFMSILPCASESSYMTGTTTISFPASPTDFSYNPKCLQVSAGATVTFSGDFAIHPLEPSQKRGAQTGNPITSTGALPDGGMTKSFTFSTPGFFAYFCAIHDSLDSGNFMSGVVWVR
jgi:plastocyanin